MIYYTFCDKQNHLVMIQHNVDFDFKTGPRVLVRTDNANSSRPFGQVRRLNTALQPIRSAAYCSNLNAAPTKMEAEMRADYLRRISICQFSTYRWNFHEDVIRYATHGFDSIGIWRRKLDDIGINTATDLLHESKLNVSSLHWAGGFTGDGKTFQHAIDDAIQSIEMAAMLDARCLILHPGSRNGHTISNLHRLLHSALKELVPVAADFGVKLSLEPVLAKRPNPWTFMDKFSDTLEILEQYKPSQLGMVLDTYEVGLNPSVFERLAKYIHRVDLVQVADRTIKSWQQERIYGQSDSLRLPLGSGDVRIARWLSKLQDHGYDGPIEVEVHGKTMQNVDYFSFLDQTRNYFESSEVHPLLVPHAQRQRIRY